MNDNKFVQARDMFMPDMHLKQPRFTCMLNTILNIYIPDTTTAGFNFIVLDIYFIY